MKCSECKDLLIEYIEDLLDAPRKANIERHLEECPMCRKEAENIQALEDRLRENSLAAGSIRLEDRVMDQILREQGSRLKAAGSAGFLYQIRSLFMKNTMLKIAAVAVAVIAVFIGLNSFQNNVTFAQVVDPILNAGTITYDVLFGDPSKGMAMHDIAVGPKIRRSFSHMGTVLILDTESMRMLSLNPDNKSGAYINIKGFVADNNQDFLQFLRDASVEAVKDPQSAVEKLGQKKINGNNTIGFRLSSTPSDRGIVIWADPDTALPIQIDLQMGESSYTICNIRFDVPVDESLVSMDPPAGYTIQDMEMNLSGASENDFLSVLQIQAEYFKGGFPDELAFGDILKLTSELGNIIPRMELKPEEMMEIGNAYIRGMMFYQNLSLEEEGHSYTGKGVRLGEGDREIFRYRMPDSSWRVIYGDLHAEELPAENARR
jgi:hypothetical protein